LGSRRTRRRTSTTSWRATPTPPTPCTTPTSTGLKLLPSHPDLAGANVELPREPGSEGKLRDGLASIRDRFAYTLLDCPPSLGPLTVNALVAADRVIVPVQTEYFALEGLAGLLDTLQLVQRELNPRLTVAGMLLTMHDARTRLAATSSARCASTSRRSCSTR
jgi:chromosome partitioning protein